MKNNYQYTIVKEGQIKICDKKDEDGNCLALLKEISEGEREEKYSCENLLNKNSCPI